MLPSSKPAQTSLSRQHIAANIRINQDIGNHEPLQDGAVMLGMAASDPSMSAKNIRADTADCAEWW